jgi:rare lipoprotein A
MLTSTWHDLIGTDIAGRYNLRTLVYGGRRQAEFVAAATDQGDHTVSVALVEPEPTETDQELAAINRARELQHPNLLHVLDGGECVLEGTPMLYVVAEASESTLAEAAAAGQIPKAQDLLDDLLAALEWLHGQGLVYRNLDPETIVRAGGRWKLADLSQVHEAGQFERCDAAGRAIPPEAASGLILPAWDLWALGVLIQDVFASQWHLLPAPLDGIALGCLDPDPERRIPVHDVRKLLHAEPVLQSSVVSGIPPADARGSEALNLNRGRQGAVVNNYGGQDTNANGVPLARGEEVLAPAPERDMPGSGREETVFSEGVEQKPSTRRLMVIVAAAVVLTGVIVALLWRPGGRATQPAAPVAVRPVAPPSAQPAATSGRPSPFTGQVSQAPAPEPPIQPPQPAPVKTRPAVTQHTGRAEYFSDDLNGHLTATGEPLNNSGLTAATRQFPLGSHLRVTNLKNGRSIVVRVNDRGSSRRGNVITVTRRAAEELGFVKDGSARVRIQLVK